MTKIKLTQEEFNILDQITIFDLGVITNNNINKNILLLNDIQFEHIYDILLPMCENIDIWNIVNKILKCDTRGIIKPFTLNAI
jgi:hypothetical protein